MRISSAGLRSGRLPATRFYAVPSSRRESHLGLRRRLGPQIMAHAQSEGHVPLLGALRPTGRRADATAVSSRAARNNLLDARRGQGMTWSRPAGRTVTRPRLRSATPWRG